MPDIDYEDLEKKVDYALKRKDASIIDISSKSIKECKYIKKYLKIYIESKNLDRKSIVLATEIINFIKDRLNPKRIQRRKRNAERCLRTWGWVAKSSKRKSHKTKDEVLADKDGKLIQNGYIVDITTALTKEREMKETVKRIEKHTSIVVEKDSLCWRKRKINEAD